MKQNYSTWMAFLVMTFAIVGMTGLIASYIAPLPLERELARDATLDQVLADAAAPDAPALLESLRPRLDDSAAAILPATPGPPPADLAARVIRERAAMHGRFAAEAAASASHLAWMIGIVTVMAAAFGVAILSFVGRAGGPAQRPAPAQNRRNPEVEVSKIRET